jgi:hypothetical protein
LADIGQEFWKIIGKVGKVENFIPVLLELDNGEEYKKQLGLDMEEIICIILIEGSKYGHLDILR